MADENHTVVAGETLESIATAAYRNAAAAIPLALVNGLAAGAVVNAGDSLTLPERLVGLGPLGGLIANLLTFVRVRAVVTSATDHFAPGVELHDAGDPANVIPGENCEIEYEIDDPMGLVTAARLEVVRKAEPGTVLFKRDLDAADFADGTHTTQWDGKCTEGAAADRYIHPVHSPYTVRVVAVTLTGDAVGRGETKVLVHSMKVARGRWVDEGAEPADGTDEAYQLKLTALGYHAGQIDGDIGSKSKLAIKDFQRDHQGLRVTGALDTYTKHWLDETAPPGTGMGHYQFILNYLGYRCGTIDGLNGKKTKRAVTQYRAAKGLPPGDVLDAATKGSLDGEALPAVTAREVLENDLTAAALHENDFPAAAAALKIYIHCDGAVAPGSLPRNKKFNAEKKALIRPHFPVIVTPMLEKIDGNPAFSATGTGPLRIDFSVDTTAPPANLGVPNATARAYVQTQFNADGSQALTGHHAHENRGGVRKDDDPGVFLTGKNYRAYDVKADAHLRFCRCVEDDGEASRGTAGVYFVPSLIAGDRFAIKVDVNGADFDVAPPAAITYTTGWMTNWRRYKITKLWLLQYVTRPHRTETSPDLGLPQWFNPAFIDFVTPQANPQPRMIASRNADHQMIDLPLFTSLCREAGYRVAQLSNAQIQTRFAANILWPLQPAAVYNAANEQAYYDAIDSEIMAFEERFGDTLRDLSKLEENGGVMALVFDENAPAAGTMGIAAITNPNLQSWAWSVLATTGVVNLIFDQDTNATAVANGAINGETLAHEVGHALWLHHASTSAGNNPAAANQGDHNPPEWQTCTMSYVALANFCGKCVLKLRGFDESKV